MTQKPSELLRKGLTSEYFLLSFLKTKSSYALGQIIQQRSVVNRKNLYTPIKKLKEAGHVIEKDRKIYPNLKKLVININDEFLVPKGTPLTSEETILLIKLLENRKFFEKISNELIHTITSQKEKIHQIDALETISDKIGFFASIFLLSRSMNPDPDKPQSVEEIKDNFEMMNVIWQQVIPQIEKVMKYGLSEIFSDKRYVRKIPYIKGVTDDQDPDETNKLKDKLMDQIIDQKSQMKELRKTKQTLPNFKGISNDFLIVMESLPTLKSFIEAPETLLLKLSKLWSENQGFELVYYFTKMNKRN